MLFVAKRNCPLCKSSSNCNNQWIRGQTSGVRFCVKAICYKHLTVKHFFGRVYVVSELSSFGEEESKDVNFDWNLQDNACVSTFLWKAASLFNLSVLVTSAAWPMDLKQQKRMFKIKGSSVLHRLQPDRTDQFNRFNHEPGPIPVRSTFDTKNSKKDQKHSSQWFKPNISIKWMNN